MELTAGFRFTWGEPHPRTILIFFGTGRNAAFGGVMLVAITAAARPDPSGRSSGLIATLAAGYLVGALLAPRLRAPDHSRAAPVFTSWISSAVVMLLAAITNPPAMGALLATALLVAAVTNVTFETELLRRTPNHLTGRVDAASILIALAAQPLGPLTGGLLVDQFGPGPSFLTFGVVIAVSATLLTLSRWRAPRSRA